MKLIENLFGRTERPELTGKRIAFAFAVALLIDGLQFAFGPLGWLFLDEALDVIGMVLISWAIGFHTLLLPTFIIELIPGPDLLPTWTGSTAAVIMLRKRARQQQPSPAIDITSEVSPVPPAQPTQAEPATGPQPCLPPKLSKQN